LVEILIGVLFGLLIGSFLNVCIYRMPRDLSVVRPRSHCPQCEKQISWYDNIPVLSYILLGARCRHCKVRIPFRYPLVELLTAASFAIVAHAYGLTPAALKGCLYSSLLIGLIFADFEQLILPDEFTIGGTLAGVLLAAFVPLPGFLMQVLLPSSTDPRLVSVAESVFAAVFCSFALWGIGELYYRVRKREGLGFGDVKMVAMIGAFQGLQGTLLTLVMGSVLGSVLGLAFILLSRKDASSYELPFGSFLGAAALAVGVYGPALFHWPRGLGL
jgi:leader peptidase (prepilin peptidase) / N-methyltransferase